MENIKDILVLDDIKKMVNEFYEKVRIDDLIGPIFNRIIQDNWPVHLEKMYRFWQTVLLNERTYSGQPFMPHAKLPVEKRHFDRWLELFRKTVDTHFVGEKADEAKWRAERMALLFNSKIDFLKEHKTKPIV